ncbi:MAG: ABC transporter substrate-binding protein [Hyphomicrobiaceae bacterium]|nr:MAG: ABC transporter substrate-binding protein [Hyphomicrobiaceae bacterium]
MQRMMIVVGTAIARSTQGRRARSVVAGCLAAGLAAFSWIAAAAPAAAADPAVVFMAQVGRELMAAARTRSPGVMANVIQRHADVRVIGNYSLGAYRAKLAESDRQAYYSGMIRFISRYAAGEAPKYPVARVEWENQSVRGGNGLMVDSRVTLADGTTYDVRWLLAKYGSTYKVRDAMVLGFWMTPFLKKLFEDYIAQNGGNPRALMAALNR